MGNTVLSIEKQNFLINGALTYGELAASRPEARGLLMNARFIQGIFDDAAAPRRWDRLGRTFDPGRNTDELIAALPQWYARGLRAFTVGLQGGGPCFTTRNETIDNNPYSADGKTIDRAYLDRLDRLIRAADRLGMAVIVSFLYAGQLGRLRDDAAAERAVAAAAGFLRENGYTNVLIEPCNEYDLAAQRPIVGTDEGMLRLMALAKRESGGMPVGCSGTGGRFSAPIVRASDVVLIHGNGQSRNRLNRLIQSCRDANPDAPIVVNEDSQDVTNLPVCVRAHASWGYYNNLTKQEPPALWGIRPGEDEFFSRRMAEAVGIPLPELPPEERFLLLGMDEAYPVTEFSPAFPGSAPGKQARFLRLAALRPEEIDRADFFVDGRLLERVYDPPFLTKMLGNWIQEPTFGLTPESEVSCEVYLRDGGRRTVHAKPAGNG